MTARLTWHQAYPGGRILAKLGAIDVGAVFPNSDTTARASFFLTGYRLVNDHKTVEAAKARIALETSLWLAKAGLQQVDHV